MSQIADDNSLKRRVRVRPDIEWSQMAEGSEATWVARDPLAMEYFHFSQTEKQVVDLLNGESDLAHVIRQSGHRGLTPSWLLQLVSRLEAACLLVPSEVMVAGRRFWQVANKRQSLRSRQLLLSPLAARVRLFDPTQLLGLLDPFAKLLFNRVFVLIWLLASMFVLYLVMLRWVASPGELGLKSLTAGQAIWMLVLYIIIKSLHELGHALACKRWDAECHEIGVLFLVFTPCLYCDTSDSWKLSSRWKRAGIAAAGIYIELMLATLAGGLWLLAAPESGLQIMAGNIMLICSLSTVLVNGNPLLRYDGYYVLSDLWQVPNLHEQSGESLRAVLDQWLLGTPLDRNRWDASPYHLAIFGVVAWCYRQFVTLMIAWLLWNISSNSGIPLVGVALVTLMLGTTLFVQLRTLVQWFVHFAGSTAQMRWWKMVPILGCLAAAVWFVAAVPLPTFARSRAVATHAALIPIYAGHTGVLAHVEPAGRQVRAGDVIVRLDSHELAMEMIDARGELTVLETRAEQLQTRMVDEEELAAELATVREQLAKLRERMAILKIQSAELELRAPLDGIILSTERETTTTFAEASGIQPPTDLMSIQQQRRLIERGTLLGWLSPAGAMDVIAYVPEATAELLRPQMSFRLRWDCQPERLMRGTVTRVASEPIAQLPQTLVGDAEIPVEPGAEGQMRPAQPHYEVRLELFELPPQLGHQSLGTVHFETAPRTVFASLKRIFDQQVRPQL